MLKYYFALDNSAEVEFIEKKSRFIAHVSPVKDEAEALEFIDGIKTKHREATHNVHAYQIGEKDEIQRANDDGEPAGTAGRPVLEVIKKEQLKNVVVVVTRYFGGIMLGAGGLIRAYGKSASLGLHTAGIVKKLLCKEVFLSLDYTLFGKVQNHLMSEKHLIKDTIYTDIVNVICHIEADRVDKFMKELTDLTNAECKIDVGDDLYISESIA